MVSGTPEVIFEWHFAKVSALRLISGRPGEFEGKEDDVV
jgi:hypothetical protein